VQITSQKHPAGTSIKSNFYFGLIGYFWFLSDYIRFYSVGEQIQSVEPVFDDKKGETEPEMRVFSIKPE